MVVAVVAMMFVCIAVAYMSFMLTGNQGPRAARALREQLIPWVDDSALSKTDQTAIIDELNDLSSKMERGELTTRQLSRLGIRMTDSTVLQWGIVEDTLRYVKASPGFNDEEKEDIQKTCDRWLRCASEGRLSMTEMEFAFQTAGLKEPRSGRSNSRIPPKSPRHLRKVQDLERTVRPKCLPSLPHADGRRTGRKVSLLVANTQA